MRGAPFLLALALALQAGGCGWPRDPDGTLRSVRGGTLRVGIVSGCPAAAADLPRLDRLTAQLGAQLEIEEGEVHGLVESVRTGRLHLLASLPTDSPFLAEVGKTRPLGSPTGRSTERIWAVTPGENGWLLVIDRFLAGDEAAEAPAP